MLYAYQSGFGFFTFDFLIRNSLLNFIVKFKLKSPCSFCWNHQKVWTNACHNLVCCFDWCTKISDDNYDLFVAYFCSNFSQWNRSSHWSNKFSCRGSISAWNLVLETHGQSEPDMKKVAHISENHPVPIMPNSKCKHLCGDTVKVYPLSCALLAINLLQWLK